MIVSELPANAGAFERTLGQVNAERLNNIRSQIPVLETLWDAWSCPESELPLLAWALSVDVWNDDWPVKRKRKVVAEALTYHRRKTTPAGVRMALSYRDAELVSCNLPRHGFFVDRAVSAEREKVWAESLPEIRIYDPAVIVRSGSPRRFAGVNLFARGDARLSRKAVLVEGGKETRLVIRPQGLSEKITFPARRRKMLIAGRGQSFRRAGPRKLDETVLAVRPSIAGGAYVRPAAVDGDNGAFVAASKKLQTGVEARFTPAGRGGLRTVAPVAIANGYISLKFSRKAGVSTAHHPLNVVGKSRVTRKPFSACWTVGWSRQLPRGRFAQGRKVAAASEPLVLTFIEAIKAASALRDEDAISLKATRRLTFADIRNIPAGTKFGDRRSI